MGWIKVKKAIKTPLSLVFTQLVSITQFWEQQNTAATEVEHLEWEPLHVLPFPPLPILPSPDHP